jgi:hypothetical protein
MLWEILAKKLLAKGAFTDVKKKQRSLPGDIFTP